MALTIIFEKEHPQNRQNIIQIYPALESQFFR